MRGGGEQALWDEGGGGNRRYGMRGGEQALWDEGGGGTGAMG